MREMIVLQSLHVRDGFHRPFAEAYREVTFRPVICREGFLWSLTTASQHER